MRRKNRNASAKSRFIAAKDLPSFYDYRIEQKCDEKEMAETRHIAEDFNSTRKIQGRSRQWKSQSQRKRARQAWALEQGLWDVYMYTL